MKRRIWQISVNITRGLLETIVAIGHARALIVVIARAIQCLAIEHLHVVGDIYDRGPGAHQILDRLMDYHSVDIQWGNHDILWMAAAGGSEACIANVIRISLRPWQHGDVGRWLRGEYVATGIVCNRYLR